MGENQREGEEKRREEREKGYAEKKGLPVGNGVHVKGVGQSC